MATHAADRHRGGAAQAQSGAGSDVGVLCTQPHYHPLPSHAASSIVPQDQSLPREDSGGFVP